MSICGKEEPGTGRMCDKPMVCLYTHSTDGVQWGVSAQPEKKKTKAKEIESIRKAIRPENPTGPPDPAEVDKATGKAVRIRPATGGSSAPAFASSQEWIDYALGVFEAFLREHNEPFTTPEHLWPLLLSPPDGEKRALSQVTSQALRRGWISETMVTRLRGTYRTADGVEFQMNKFVPIYVSLITRPFPQVVPSVSLDDVD